MDARVRLDCSAEFLRSYNENDYINSPGSGPILGASLRKLIKIKALVVDIVLIGLLVP